MNHPAQHELISYIDGELAPSERRSVELHMNTCDQCREAWQHLTETSAEVAAMHASTSDRSPAPLVDQQAALAAKLHTMPPSAATTRRPLFAFASTLAYAAAVLILTGAGWVFFSMRARAHDQALALPNPAYTPGAVRQVSLNEICAANDDEVVRDVPSSIEQTVFREYGLGQATPGDYEVDHLITPGLGGSDDVANLWPQPHSSQWNSFVKDQLEDHLHHMVCRGQLPLSAAQHEIASNWIAAYKKYFHTQEPLRASGSSQPIQRLALLR